jgi:hypothetical protein
LHLLKIQWRRAVKEDIGRRGRTLQAFPTLACEKVTFAELLLAIAVRKIVIYIGDHDLFPLFNLMKRYDFDLCVCPLVVSSSADSDNSVVVAAMVQSGGQWVQDQSDWIVGWRDKGERINHELYMQSARSNESHSNTQLTLQKRPRIVCSSRAEPEYSFAAFVIKHKFCHVSPLAFRSLFTCPSSPIS